jgi:aarF domain-containing kinase
MRLALFAAYAACGGTALRAGIATSPSRAPFVSMQLKNSAVTAGVTAATAVLGEVSKSVGDKGIEAPEATTSFVSMDEARTDLVDEDGLPLAYNKEAIQKYWSGQEGALQKRWLEFLSEAVPFLTKVASCLITGGTDALNENARELAKDARVSIEKLGPTYVKMGQMMSVRPDVLPQAALDELTVLQDGVEGFETSIARSMLEKELGAPLEDIFDEFGEAPAAAASLAQVYRARLRETGEYVAVKVQRPGVQQLVSKDLYVLRRAAEIYQGLVTRFAPQQRTDYVALLNEWAVGFYTELDFVNEASNMRKMGEVLGDAGITDVRVPKVFDKYTTRRVLVSEWIDGRKLSECEPSEIRELIAIGQECFLVQLLQAGFFHSDPHPGNLMRPDDQSGAKLVLIDFGLVAQVEQDDMDAMVSSIVHLANKDYAALVDDFIRLNILPDDCNRAKVIPLMDKALSPYVKGGGAKMYEEELKKLYGMDGSVDGAVGGFQAMTNDMLTVLNDIPFSIPAYFALLARAVVTLEGLALSADPSYGLVIEAYPFVARKLLSSDRPELQQALQEVLYSGTTPGGDGLRGVITPTRLAGLLNSAAGIVAKQEGQAFVDLDAVPEDGVTATEALKYVLSPSAQSLRELLAGEAENAADLLLRQALRKSVPLVAAAIPQPPKLPFLPAPPEPLNLPLPIFLPSAPAASLLTTPASDLPSSLLSGGATPVLTTGQELLEALAPPLSRDEELYAISLVDLCRSSFGDQTASLLAGDLAQDPQAAASAAIPLLEGLLDAVSAESQGNDAPSSALLQLTGTTIQLLKSLPGVMQSQSGGDAPIVDTTANDLKTTISSLDGEQRATMQHLLSGLGSALASKLDERLLALH